MGRAVSIKCTCAQNSLTFRITSKSMKMHNKVAFLLFVLISLSEGEAVSPARLSPVVIPGGSNGSCPADGVLVARREAIKDEITPILSGLSVAQSPCACGGPGQWSKLAFFNMSDPSQQCPSGWNLFTSPVRGCITTITSAPSCDSAIFPSNGKLYSRVCGRVIAYQKGSVNAFNFSIPDSPGIEGPYVDGISLTHGAPGSRQHIWTFAGATYEISDESTWICPCSTSFNWPHQVPSFVGNNYFCETGNDATNAPSGTIYTDDPLWDGSGCGSGSSCCEFNNPPWFCATLPQPTTDDLELRICHDQESSNEEVIISLIELNVK